MKPSIADLAKLVSEDPAMPNRFGGTMQSTNMQNDLGSAVNRKVVDQEQQRLQQRETAQKRIEPQFDAMNDTLSDLDGSLEDGQEQIAQNAEEQTAGYGDLDQGVMDLKDLLRNIQTIQPQI